MSLKQPLGAPSATPQTRPYGRETRALLPATLLALIDAILARLFARIEHLLQLWQSGTLPTPPIRHPKSHNATAAPRPTPARTRHTHARNPTHPPTVILSEAKDPRFFLRTTRPPIGRNPPPRGIAPASIRLPQSRAPPRNRPKPCLAAPHHRAIIIAI